MKDGRTIIRARAHDSEFTVTSDTLDVKVPDGKLTAQGKVRLTGPNVEATADKLSIHLAEDQLLIEGGAAMKCRDNAGAEMEMQFERCTFRVARKAAAPDSKKEPERETRRDELSPPRNIDKE